MAPKNDSGTKRKLPSRSKDSNIKKPKYDKRPPPPPTDEEDSISDDNDSSDGLGDDEEGGASLNGNKAQNNGRGPTATQDADGKTFERGKPDLAPGFPASSANSAQAKLQENPTRNRNNLRKIERPTGP
jgi:hypothetical protein